MIKKLLSIIALTLLLTGCYNSNDAQKALQSEGLTQVQVTGHAWFACADDDFYATSFTAINVHGKQVSGAVCSGFIFKNSTIRW